jgi:iron(III) transport system substrate-binding protein
VVVYVSISDESALAVWFAGFTRDTGIPVTLRYAESSSNTKRVIENRGSPPADVLITDNVADIWRAADKGALRPISSPALATVSGLLRDPDNLWVALDYRLAVIASGANLSASPPESYADLAKTEYHGQLCLASSELSLGRSLIAMMIDDVGARRAELIVRGWLRNLALPPFATQEKLLNAITVGTCAFGILSDTVAGGANRIVPDGAYFDIDAMGVARHARYPESAQRLLDWILSNTELDVPDRASRINAGIAGWRDEEARLLVERARYR